MDYDRLRELQAKFDENPRRYFAPLANEYRKGGNPKRAIEICRAHLAQMPGHMSGQVVFGQSLFEGGEHEEARKVFEGALVLDPENLIALRSLGDLALQAGNTDEARSWYERLLEADPKDSAVIALVSEIDASTDASTPAGAAEIPGVDLDAGDQAIPQSLDSSSSSEEQTASEFTVDFSFVDNPPVSDAPLGLEHHYPTGNAGPAVAEPMGSDRDALDWTPPASDLAHQEAAPQSNEKPSAPFDADSVPFGDPPVAADASSMFGDTSGFGDESSTPTSSFAGTNAEPFVNETMAQLYLQQGYKQLALRVYRQLSERKPSEQSFRDRIAEIEASLAAETDQPEPVARRQDPPSIESPLTPDRGNGPSSVETPDFDRSPVDSPPSSFPAGEPDSIESPAREQPRGEPEGIAARQPSMREFFATLGRRRPPRPAPAPASRWNETPAPTSSAAAPDSTQTASLDAVFAGAKVSATDARAASALAGAFSVTARGTTAPTPAANPTPRANPRLQTHESEEDVAKFRAWLDGLTGE